MNNENHTTADAPDPLLQATVEKMLNEPEVQRLASRGDEPTIRDSRTVQSDTPETDHEELARLERQRTFALMEAVKAERDAAIREVSAQGKRIGELEASLKRAEERAMQEQNRSHEAEGRCFNANLDLVETRGQLDAALADALMLRTGLTDIAYYEATQGPEEWIAAMQEIAKDALSAPPPPVVSKEQYDADRALMNERLEERTQGNLAALAKARTAPNAASFRAGWEAGRNIHDTPFSPGLEQSLREHMDGEVKP